MTHSITDPHSPMASIRPLTSSPRVRKLMPGKGVMLSGQNVQLAPPLLSSATTRDAMEVQMSLAELKEGAHPLSPATSSLVPDSDETVLGSSPKAVVSGGRTLSVYGHGSPLEAEAQAYVLGDNWLPDPGSRGPRLLLEAPERCVEPNSPTPAGMRRMESEPYHGSLSTFQAPRPSPISGGPVGRRLRSSSLSGGPPGSKEEGGSLVQGGQDLISDAYAALEMRRVSRSVSQTGAPPSPTRHAFGRNLVTTPTSPGPRTVRSARPALNPRMSWSGGGGGGSGGGGGGGSPTASRPTLRYSHAGSSPSLMTAFSVPNGKAKLGPGKLAVDVVAPAASVPIDLPSKAQILERLQKQRDSLEASSNLLTMFLNRCNSSWPNGFVWGGPNYKSAAEEQGWARGGSAAAYKADFLRKLRNGKVSNGSVHFDSESSSSFCLLYSLRLPSSCLRAMTTWRSHQVARRGSIRSHCGAQTPGHSSSPAARE